MNEYYLYAAIFCNVLAIIVMGYFICYLIAESKNDSFSEILVSGIQQVMA